MYVFDDKLGRRKFLKMTGAGAAVATATGLSGCSFGSHEHSMAVSQDLAKEWNRSAGQWIPSCCHMCGGTSGILAHVANGVVDKIEPNHWNPINYSNISTDFFEGYTEEYGCGEGGSICPKGNAGIMQLYDPDRVKKPLKRTNRDKSPGADPKWQEISWDQALDEIAGKMKILREGSESHKLLWMTEDASFVDIQTDFCKLYGTPNFSMHSNLCDVGRKASFKMVMGDERPIADFVQSKYILLFGWNPTSAIKWVYLPRILTRAVEKGARLVVVDPYLSDTAAKAQEWVPIRPGTDGALALAMGNVIIRDNLYDKDFVTNWVSGFDEYAAYVKDKTPEWAESITTVPAKTIERLAHDVATTKPACIDSWSGPGQHTNGVQSGRAIAALGALLGAYDRPGSMMIADKKGGKHSDVEINEATEKSFKMPRYDRLKEKYPLGHSSGVYTEILNNLLTGKGPYDLKMAVCVFQNPMMSTPGGQTAEALAKLETFVVVDTMLSETAMLADYVLPGTSYLERYELCSHWVTWPALGLRQPVVKPLFGQPAEYEIVTALGRRLGLRDKSGKDFFTTGALSGQPIQDLTAWYEDYLSAQLKGGAPAITLAELKALPGAVWIDKKGTKYEKFTSALPEDKLKDAFFDGDKRAEGTAIYDKPKDKGGKRIGTVIRGVPVRGFFTTSGKAELFNAKWGEKKDANGNPVDPLPGYKPRDWQPDVNFPLYLINWKEASHTHSRTQNNPWLLEIKGSNPLAIHPETAKKLGISEDDEVWVESPHGKVKARVHLTRRMHEEVVGAQHGFGHKALGSNARGRGSAFAGLNIAKSDPLSGQAVHKEICVKVYKV
jgi:thiosulfate reductase / polysulfide reductase chain A